jgi:hypothetical protein
VSKYDEAERYAIKHLDGRGLLRWLLKRRRARGPSDQA